MHTCNPSTREADAGASPGQGQPGPHSETGVKKRGEEGGRYREERKKAEWCISVVLLAQEAEAGELLEITSPRTAWTW